MRVLQLCADKGVPPGGTKGASAHLRHVAGALVDRGHTVRTLARRAAQNATPHPVPVELLVDESSIDTSVRALGGVDLVYERYSLGHTAGLTAARRHGAVFALEVNAPLVFEANAHRSVPITAAAVEAEERLFREADVVVAVSSVLADHITEIRGTRSGVAVIPNGANPADFSVPATHEGPPVLVFLGHPKPWHGADRMVEVARRLEPEFEDLSIAIIGGGPGADAVLSAAALHSIEHRFHVTGPLSVRGVTTVLGSGSVGVAPYPPSDFFYFSPLKIVEYLMAGLPVVATDVGDIAATVGESGIVVSPDDVDAFADACAVLLRDREYRAQVGEAARSRAVRQMSWDHAAESIERAVTMEAAR